MAELCRRCGQPLTVNDRPAKAGDPERCARCGERLLPTEVVPAEPHGLGIAAGEVLDGKWRIESALGSGGMGSVYLAQDLGLGRKVAIKVLAPRFATDPAFAARFEREARATARLEHPNVVPVYAVGSHRDRPFIVMKALEGAPLSRLLRERLADGRPPSREEVLSLFAQLCGALGYLHAKGYVHRDVKPANVFVGTHGHVTLLDFGVLHDAAAERLTLAGTQLGTPCYAAPEQLRGDPEIDPRADVYALGVMLFEVLAQRLPYSGEPTTLLRQQEQATAPALDSLVPGLPAAVAAVARRALSPSPDQRFASALELASALERAWPARDASSVALPADLRPTLPADGLPVWRAPAPAPAPVAAPSLDSAVKAAGLDRRQVLVPAIVLGVALLGLGLLLLPSGRRGPSVSRIPDPPPPEPAMVLPVPAAIEAPAGLDAGRAETRVKRPEGEYSVPVF